ncbi:glycosyltransferase [uncultured Christiangramia sp.]|uniref:glycosyltransferase family 2 protein n=1 Tax=uncultured Christiangramia sp. TaxID=503836 RepID=UPI002606CD60|nr:glycosyltransferase [uncultured Christiangramia sp.]
MNFTLIICTYKRAESLLSLLKSVEVQTLYPHRILIIDGSPDIETAEMLKENQFQNLDYFKVDEKYRGLTRQRNFGIDQLKPDCDIVCFLDDDVILEKEYFNELLSTYQMKPEALAVAGYITNDTNWQKTQEPDGIRNDQFIFDGWSRVEGSRFGLRRKFGLAPDEAPGMMPDFSHGYSTAFLPPSNKIYEVEMLMGGISSYRVSIFKELLFSEYFEGYGLYEDADFSLRLARKGKLFVNTAARLEHHHDASGRPDQFKYGKMVLRNGYYVWRVKYPRPSVKARLKWHATALLLTCIRLSNVLTSTEKKEAFVEASGRLSGWLSLLMKKPSDD